MKMSKPNRNRIVKGVIGLVFLILTLLSYKYFSHQDTKDKSNSTETMDNLTLNSKDSSSQILLNNKQNNSNIGNQTNEYIMGDKVVNNNDIPVDMPTQSIKKQNQEKQPSIQFEKIENNGNLSIGQTGGVVHQTTINTPKKLARRLSDSDVKLIINKIPLQYTVDVNYPMTNKESESFAYEIIGLLNYHNYKKITRSMYGQIAPDLEESFTIILDDSIKSAEITVYRQK